MKYFWEGAKTHFAENVDGIASFPGGPAEVYRLKALAGSRIVNENGVPCSWDDVIGLIPEEPSASPGKHGDGDPKPRPRGHRPSKTVSKPARRHS